MENFTKGSLNQNGSGFWRKLGGALLGLVMLFVFASSASAQVFHTEDFEGATTWASGGAAGFGVTGTVPCESSISAYSNLYENWGETATLTSGLLGTSNGLLTTVSFVYKIVTYNDINVGGDADDITVFVQYGATATGPWTTAYTINSGSHVPSASCATPSFTFTPPAGNLFMKFDCIWNDGDVYLFLDAIDISQYTPTCAGDPAAGTATISSVGGCSGGGLTLTAAGLDAGTGISAQWEYSSDAFVTDINDLVGETSATANVTSPATTVHYRVRSECNDVPSISYSNVVSYAGVSCATVVVPFTGNAVNICGTDALITDHAGSGVNYSNYANGYLVLENTPGVTISLTGSYHVEGGPYDRLEIYSGVGTSGTSLGSYDSYGAPASTITPITSLDGENITIEFFSDNGSTREGFELTAIYTGTCAVCAGTPATGTPAISDADGCAVAPVTLTATGLDYVNVDYQWQVSNDDFAADINDIGGATNATANATTPAGVGVTYYRIKSTCTDDASESFSASVSYTSILCGAFNLPGVSGNDNALVCGTNTWLYDDAGGAANYQSYYDAFTVLDASLSAVISLSGNYEMHDGWDYIHIYEGVGTSGTEVPGSPFTGTGPIDITGNVGEALTVRLISSSWTNNAAGFAFQVLYSGTCASCTAPPASGTVSIPSTVGCSGGTMTLTSAGLDITGDNTYQWQVSTDDFVADINDISGETGQTFDLTTVTGTNYYRIQSFCSADLSAPAYSPSVSFEGFACTPFSLPTSGSNSVTCGVSTNLTDDGGLLSDYSNNADGYTVFEASLTAQIALSGTFATEGCCDRIYIYYGVGTVGTQVPGSPFAGSGTINVTGTVGEAITVRLDADFSVADAGLDLTVLYSGTCDPCAAAPGAAAATLVTSNSATVNWTAAAVVPGDGYEWEVRDDAALPGTGGEVATGTTNNATFSAALGAILAANTTYTAYFRSVCTTGTELSEWTTGTDFTTACPAEVAPTVSESFTTFSSAAPDPVCWSEATGAIGTPSVLAGTTSGWIATTGYANTGSNPAVKDNLWGSAGTNNWMISQPIDLGSTPSIHRVRYNAELTFYNSATTTTDMGANEVNIIVSSDGGATWNAADVIYTHTGTFAGGVFAHELIGYSGIIKVAIVNNIVATSPDRDFHFDDFIVEVTPTCFAPTVTAVTNLTNTSATLNWLASSPAPDQYYRWEVRDDAALPGSGGEIETGVTADNVTLTANTTVTLTGNTTYSVYVQGQCLGADVSTWDGPFDFTTECDPLAAPTTNEPMDGFVSTSSAPLTCWKEGNGAVATPSVVTIGNSSWAATSGFGNMGSDAGIKHNLWGVDAGDWVISPQIDLGVTPGVYRISYNMAVTGYNSSSIAGTLGAHQMHVIVSTDGGATWNVADIIATHTGAGTYSATTYTHDLTTQTGIIKVAFVNVEGGTTPDVDIHLDDFIVEVIPPCVAPTAAATTLTTDVTATINWVAPGTLPGVGYNYEVRTSGLPESGSPDASGDVLVGTDLAAITGLVANTTYTVYVRSECTAGTQYSAWATIGVFTTACTPEVAPTVPQTFDSFSGSAPDPECWSEGQGAIGTPSPLTGSTSVWGSSTSFVNVAADASARINLFSGTNAWLISQPVDLGGTAGDFRVSFDMGARPWSGGAASTDLGSHEVSVIVSTDAGATWNAADVIATYTGAGTYDGSTVTIDLTAYSGVVKVAFVSNTSSFSPDLYFYVDDFFIQDIPTCFEPTALTATSIEIDGADVSWTAPALGTTIGYEYEVSTTATPPTTGTSVVATSVTGITGLTSGTVHYLHVRAECVIPGDLGQWVTYSFTTLYENPFCNAAGVAIPDNGCGSSTFLEQAVLVSGITGLLGTDVIVNKCAINITHTWDGDLTISLISPAATEVLLSDGNGGSANNYGGAGCNNSPTVFSMGAASAITSGSAPFSGSYIPEGDFSAFDGEDPNGFWTLKICDGANGDEGELVYFRLQIIPPPTCFAPVNLASSGVTPTAATVAWDAGTGAPGPSSYQFYYNTTGVAPDEFTVPTGPASGLSIYLNTLSPGTTYFIWVRSDCGLQKSDWSSSLEFDTPLGNDLCSGATPVICGGSYSDDCTTASAEVIPGSAGSTGPGLWYSYTGTGGDVTFETCNGPFFDSEINVLTGTCGALTSVANNDDDCGTRSRVTVSTLAGTVYYVYVSSWSSSAAGNAFTLDVTCEGFWTGNVDAAWANVGNWSDGVVPGTGQNAVIPSSPAGGNFPDVSGAAPINDLVVQSGATVDVLDGASVTIEGDLTNNGTINVANNGSFVQETGSLLLGSGIFNVTKIGGSLYDYWSSPITNGSLGAYYAFNSANSTIDPADDENDPGWYQTSGAIPVGRGGAFYGAGTRTFSGVANNGDVAVAVTDNAAPADDWDLLGNPYPSGISVSGVLGNAALTGGLAFWDETSYATHNGLIGAAGGGGNTPTGTIGTCQGFMAFAAPGGGTVTYNNAMRVAGNDANLFRLAQIQTLKVSAVPANVTSPPFSQTVIGFADVSANGLDQYDTPKLGVLDDISLFSYIDASEYSINFFGPLVAATEIPLGLNSNSATSVTVTLDEFTDMDNDNIVFEDRMMGVFTDLKGGDYTFQAMAQLYTNRFFLHVSSSAVTGIADELSAGMNAYVADEMLNLYSTNDVTGNLEILDMTGKIVMSQTNLTLGSTGIQLPLTGLSDGAYIVRVVGADVNMSRKIVK